MESHSKIKELTEKIYREGLEKGNEKARLIISESKNEAKRILDEADTEAEAIIERAGRKALELSERMESEIRISARQALLDLKKEISDLVQVKVMKEPLKEAFNDSEFIKRIIETVINNWNPDMSEPGLKVLLPKDQLEEAENYFRQKTSVLLNERLKLREHPDLERGFEIYPHNGHYKISMTDETFEAFLRSHFKAKTVEFLFEGKDK